MSPKILSIQEIRVVEGASVLVDAMNKRFVEVLVELAEEFDLDPELVLKAAGEIMSDQGVLQDEEQ